MSKPLISNSTPPSPSSTDSVTYAILRTVADAKGVSPLDLEPLGNVIDPDALNELVDSMPLTTDVLGTVEFRYEGYDVTVRANGRVDVVAHDD